MKLPSLLQTARTYQFSVEVGVKVWVVTVKGSAVTVPLSTTTAPEEKLNFWKPARRNSHAAAETGYD